MSLFCLNWHEYQLRETASSLPSIALGVLLPCRPPLRLAHDDLFSGADDGVLVVIPGSLSEEKSDYRKLKVK
ncbi:Heat Shock Factor Protein 5 [Manis pentadactyla]|nr:Heat Shock Factor Protein 5 [Manis pentadactyla]